MKKSPIDKDRIYITGYSKGGYGTWHMIARYPEFLHQPLPIVVKVILIRFQSMSIYLCGWFMVMPIKLFLLVNHKR